MYQFKSDNQILHPFVTKLGNSWFISEHLYVKINMVLVFAFLDYKLVISNENVLFLFLSLSM